MIAAPFAFPARYRNALELVHKGVRTFHHDFCRTFVSIPRQLFSVSPAMSLSKARPQCGSSNSPAARP